LRDELKILSLISGTEDLITISKNAMGVGCYCRFDLQSARGNSLKFNINFSLEECESDQTKPSIVY